MSRRKRIAFSLIMLMITWLIIDLILYFSFAFKLNKLFSDAVPPSTEAIEEQANNFHPRWGWDIPQSQKGYMGSRKSSHTYREKDTYTIKAFGDSFTEGLEVGDDETWERYVEEKTGWDCLNYGVRGYGPDLALLKYRDVPIKTKYVIIGIMDENIGRLMTLWWGFYTRLNTPLIKPRFTYQNGEVVLIGNPITKANDLYKLQDQQFINHLKLNDYWYEYYQSINMPSRPRWPATFTIITHADYFARVITDILQNAIIPSYESRVAMHKFYSLYEEESEGMNILKHILREFIHTARERSEIPIVLIFPKKKTTDIVYEFGKKPHQALVDFLESIDAYYIDYTDIFIMEDYHSYYVHKNGGHYSPKGNERVAEELIDRLKFMQSATE